MLGEDEEELGDTRAALLISPSIEIESYSFQSVRQQTHTNFPKGILTPDRNRKHQGEASLKSVSFNPQTEFKFLEEQ